MAIVGHFPTQTTQKELAFLPFRLKFDGSNDPVITEGKEFIASAAISATGVCTITLKDKYVAVSGSSAILEAATAVDLVAQAIPPVPASKTVGFRLNAGATPTNPPAAGSNATYLQGLLALRNV